MPKRLNRNRRVDDRNGRLYHWLLNSSAYLSLSSQARAVLVEIAQAYNGTKSGRIGLSVRRASERCNIARGTADGEVDRFMPSCIHK